MKKVTADKHQARPMGGPGGGHGPGGMMMSGEKPKDFKGAFRKLAKLLSQYKISLIVVLIFAIASTVFTIVGPKILGQATTKLFEGVMNTVTGTGNGVDFTYIGQILLYLIGLYVISAVFSYIQGYIMTGISMKVTYHLRRDIAAKIHKLPFSYYDSTSNGEVLSHITNDVDSISQSLNQSATQIVTSVTMIIGILVMMFSINWQMTLVALLIVPISLIFIVNIIKKSQKHFAAQQEYLGHVNGHVEEMYAGHTVVKAFNREEESAKVFDKYNGTLYSSAWKSQFRINDADYEFYQQFGLCGYLYYGWILRSER